MTKEETLGNLEDILQKMRYTAYASDSYGEMNKTDVGKIETLATQLDLLVKKMKNEDTNTVG